MINIEKVVSFIDDIIVETEEEEKHNEVVEEVVRRLVKNNLYIKLVAGYRERWKVTELVMRNY